MTLTSKPRGPKPKSMAFKAYLCLEFIVVFFGFPTYLSLEWAGFSPIIVLLLVFIGMIVYLAKSPDFPNRNFFRLSGNGGELKRILLIFACLGSILLAYALLRQPEQFLSFARSNPLIYALVMILYPLLSAYPQEVIYRGFLFTRYSALFGTGPAMVLLSGLTFGYGHIIFQNYLSVVLSTAGGMLFALTYSRSRSLVLTTFEHALYGCLIFTIGLGRYFYHGVVQI